MYQALKLALSEPYHYLSFVALTSGALPCPPFVGLPHPKFH